MKEYGWGRIIVLAVLLAVLVAAWVAALVANDIHAQEVDYIVETARADQANQNATIIQKGVLTIEAYDRAHR